MNKPRQGSTSNPWNKNVQQKKKPKPATAALSSNQPTPDQRFKEAHLKLQNAVKKHIKDYESSSDEEEIKSSKTVIDTIVNKYTQSGGTDDQIGRLAKYLEDAFHPGAAVCLICISKVKMNDHVWNCCSCFGIFHLLCVQRWSKDTLVQQKHATENHHILNSQNQLALLWCCPKCRFEYSPQELPTKYWCFCGKTENPKFDPFLVPHSCGEICKKDLTPSCGHKCLLLCHPGPCPPCPVTVSVKCYCGSGETATKRCCNKEWSCGDRCGKTLPCGKHTCPDPCHPGDCKPCSKKSIQKCMCQSRQQLRDCASPEWQCDKVCNKPLDCGFHICQEVCHSGVCNVCVLTLPRTCPCGKTMYQLPCTKETPTCNDTCGKLLECGIHTCSHRCHKDSCGPCLEIVTKSCRCGQYSKDVQCSKPYFCEVKCKMIRDCKKHPCNRKCCDGNCPPCEKPCGHTLQCNSHKCASVCHRGPCYPCQLTDVVTCRCGSTKITVPCGRKNRTKPPKCFKPCLIPPDCDHPEREKHRCHFGDCPTCKQVCGQSRSTCDHPCPAMCHSAVLVKVETQKASMPWEQTKPLVERKRMPCPDCVVPMPVTCLGDMACLRSMDNLERFKKLKVRLKLMWLKKGKSGLKVKKVGNLFKKNELSATIRSLCQGEHETSLWPCHLAVPSSCGRPCGRLLQCGNHLCSLLCHLVESAPDSVKAGTNCDSCDGGCTKPRPEGCPHPCPKPCHPGDCPPCTHMVRIKCHCGLNQPYVQCNLWLDLENRESLQSCGNQCPKNFPCGHRCKTNCHSGPCPNAELCKKKMKIFCKCKRIKKEIACEVVRKQGVIVPCDEICKKIQEENRKKQEILDAQLKEEEKIRNQKELEKYQKMFEGKKKPREKRTHEDVEETGFLRKNWFILLTCVMLVTSVGGYLVLNN